MIFNTKIAIKMSNSESTQVIFEEKIKIKPAQFMFEIYFKVTPKLILFYSNIYHDYQTLICI